ncbi:MAG: NUDIX domain-containing protein [Alphaproteobacteria bacterium]|nr:NUDIX domain-containing protein [Alphaproteobacteria bacterium]
MTKMKFEILGREALFQGYFRMDKLSFRHELFGGGWSAPYTRETLDRGQVAALLPYDPVRDAVVLNRQIRPGPIANGNDDPWITEIVAGVIDGKDTAEETARREAEEEAGCRIIALQKMLHYYPTPGIASECITLFIGHVDTSEMPARAVHGLPEENEDIEATVVSCKEAFELLKQDKLRNALAIIALQWLALRHSEVREKFMASQAGAPLI